MSLSDLGLIRYRVMTDGQTDRIPIATTHSEQYLPVQLSHIIILNDTARVVSSRHIMQDRYQ